MTIFTRIHDNYEYTVHAGLNMCENLWGLFFFLFMICYKGFVFFFVLHCVLIRGFLSEVEAYGDIGTGVPETTSPQIERVEGSQMGNLLDGSTPCSHNLINEIAKPGQVLRGD